MSVSSVAHAKKVVVDYLAKMHMTERKNRNLHSTFGYVTTYSGRIIGIIYPNGIIRELTPTNGIPVKLSR